MFRGLRAIGIHVRFEATPRNPMVEYPQNAPSLSGYPVRVVGRVPSDCTFGLMLPRMLRGLLTPGMHPHFEAIPHASRVVYPRSAPSL